MTRPYEPSRGDRIIGNDATTGWPRRGRFVQHDGTSGISVIRLYGGSLRFVFTETITEDPDASD